MRDLKQWNVTPFPSVACAVRNIEHAHEHGPFHVITANPEIVFTAVSDPEYCQIFMSANLVVADGIGVSAPLRWKGYRSNRIPGIELVESLMHSPKANPRGAFLLGAAPDVVSHAFKVLEAKGIALVGFKDGYFSAAEFPSIVEEIKRLDPSLVAVAMGAPRQDFVIEELKKNNIDAILIGVGGALDVWAGKVKRAPKLMQKLNLEWLYRLLGDLRRLPRYSPIVKYFNWLFKAE